MAYLTIGLYFFPDKIKKAGVLDIARQRNTVFS